MSEVPEPPMPWDGSCNIEPDWLNDLAEGMLRDQFLTRSLLLTMMPIIGFGVLPLLGLMPVRKLPFHIRVWNGVKGLFTFKGRN